jgi:uncharacterized Fe-S radical SAM superfamily protein PflX
MDSFEPNPFTLHPPTRKSSIYFFAASEFSYLFAQNLKVSHFKEAKIISPKAPLELHRRSFPSISINPPSHYLFTGTAGTEH